MNELDLSAIDLSGLEQDPDFFEAAPGPKPTIGRIAKVPGEALRRAGRAYATSARSHFEHLYRDPSDPAFLRERMRAETDLSMLGGKPSDDQIFYSWLRANPDQAVALSERIEAGEDPSAARWSLAADFYAAKKEKVLAQHVAAEQAKLLESPPEFRGKSSGWFEDALMGVFGSLPSTIPMLINPALGAPPLYAHLQGAIQEAMEQGAKEAGMPVDPERIFTASSRAALISSPMELVGEILKIRGIMGSGPFMARLGLLAEAFGGEAMTEFAQSYPEDVAIRWALNPDLDAMTLMDHFQDTITDPRSFKKSVYEGFVGGVAGLMTAGGGMMIHGGAQSLIHHRQKEINRQRQRHFRELLGVAPEDLSIDQKVDLLSMVGIDAAPIMEADPARLDAVVETVRGRILFQGDPIKTPGRDNIAATLRGRRNMSPENVGLMLNIWDGIARAASENGLIEKPEDFYSDWLGGVRLSNWEEFNAAQVKQQALSMIKQHGPALFQQVAAAAPESLTGFTAESEVARQRLGERQKAGLIDLTNPDEQTLHDVISLMADDISGFNEARLGAARQNTLRRAQEFIEQSMAELGDDHYSGAYVEMDLKNLGGLNALLGSSGANKVYRAMADVIRSEMSKLSADVSLFRHGGDEMSAVVVGATRAQVEEAMLRAQIEVERFARQKTVDGLALIDIPHAKYPDELTKRGTGVTFAIENIDPAIEPEQIISRADKLLEDRKKGLDHEHTRSIDAARLVAFGEQTRRAPKSVEQAVRRLRQREGGKPQGPDGKVQPDQDQLDLPSDLFFQDQEAPRGAVAYLQEQTPKLIYLFENADDSTLIHESGHILLEMIHRARSADYAVAAKWAGVDPSRAAGGTAQWTTAELEKFAKGFELYMIKGQAPTMRLHAVFKRLQTLLLNIYAKIRDSYFKDVAITEDIRAVFDRWVASEYERTTDPFWEVSEWFRVEDLEIHNAEMIRQAQAEPGAWAELEYEQVVAEARRRTIERKAARKQQLYKDLDQRFKRQAVEIVEADPFYEILAIIQNKNGKYNGLSIKSLRDLYDQAYINDILAKRPGLFRADGMPVDVVANEFGYDTTDELVQEILNRPGKQQAIDQAFDDLWREYESTEHLANVDTYAESLEVEIELINEMMGRKKPAARTDLKKIIREQTGQTMRQAPNARELRAQLQRDARVARQAWKEAAALAREMEKAKGDSRRQDALKKERARKMARIVQLKQAHLEKVRALREHYNQRFTQSRIMQRINRQIRNKRMLPEYRAQIANFLSGYIKLPASLIGHPPSHDLSTFLEQRAEAGEVLDTLKALLAVAPERRKPGGRLGFVETETIGNIVDALVHMEINERKARLINEKEAVQQVADEMVDSIIDTYPMPNLTDGPLGLKELSFMDRSRESLREWFAELRKPEFIFRAMDGFKVFGPNYRHLFEPLKKAEDAKLTMGAEYLTRLKENWKGFDRKWARKRYKIRDLPGTITKEQMIMVALNAGNNGNRAALEQGNGLPDTAIDDVIGKLTQDEQRLVVRTWDLIDSLFPDLDRVHRKLTGVRLAKVDGRYFPLKFDPRASWEAGKHQAERELRDMFANQYIWARVEAGHRMERTGGKLPVRLDFSVIYEHIEKTIHDITHQIPVRDVQKLLHNDKYRNTVRAWVGPEIYAQLTPWLANVANPQQADPDGAVAKVASRMRKNATIVALGWKLTTATQQILGISQAMHEIGFWPTVKGVVEFIKHPARIAEKKRWVDSLSPSMRHRGVQWDRELSNMYKRFDPTAMGGTEAAKDALFAMIQFVDSLTVYPTWMGAYDKAMAGEVDDIDAMSTDLHSLAVQYADQAVRVTQPTGMAKDTAAIQRGGEVKKLFTMFQSFFNVFQNQMMEINSRVHLKKIGAGQWMASHLYLLLAPAILGFMINERRWPTWEEFVKEVIRYRLGGIPLVRDLVSGMASDYGYQMSPIQGAGSRLVRTYKQFERMATGKPVKGEALAKDLIYSGGYVVGIPSGAVVIALDGAMDLAEGRTQNPARLFIREKREAKK